MIQSFESQFSPCNHTFDLCYRMSYYSSPEVAFAKSWLNAADYVAAAYFQSSLNNSVLFMRPLPSRVLQEGDSAPNIADLSTEENHTLYVFGWMARMNTILCEYFYF